MTIREAAIQVLKESGQPMSAKEIYEAIIKKGLFKFGAKNPISVLNGTIRQHTKGIDNKSSKPDKNFDLVDGNRYKLS